MTDKISVEEYLIWDKHPNITMVPPCLEIRFIKIKTPLYIRIFNIKQYKWKAVGYLYNYKPKKTVEEIKNIIKYILPNVIITTKINDHSDLEYEWGDIELILTFESPADEAEFIMNELSYYIVKKISIISSLKIL
jgi:hypothetical protein